MNVCLQVLRDFVRVLNPANFHSTIVGWNRRWLLRLDGNERQKYTPAVCDNKSGEGSNVNACTALALMCA
jgi:hypothetical protein